MIKLPELPGHPDPHTYRWTDAEVATMREYAAAVSAADNAALLAENADQQKVIAAYEMCNPPWAQALREIVEGAAAADEFLDSPEAIYRLARMARAALKTAEAALADIGDSDREPGDDLEWCERRAAQALPAVRAALEASK